MGLVSNVQGLVLERRVSALVFLVYAAMPILEILLFIMSYALILAATLMAVGIILFSSAITRLPTDEEIDDTRNGHRRYYEFTKSHRID